MEQVMKRELITPKKAQEYLDHNKGNRKLRDGVVEKYQIDMANGKWTECPVPISFYENGDIADGQHRLWAIVESGISVSFFICRGLKKEAGLNIDTNIPRTIVDNARISGTDPNLSNELVALAQFYKTGTRNRISISNAERLAIVERYRAPCVWAISNGPKGRGYRNAPMLAAVARAYTHGETEERLREFAKVLASGFVQSTEDSAAIALRNYIIAHEFKAVGIDGRDFFFKVQNCIKYFAQRRPLNVVKLIKDEAYPLKKVRA